MTNFIFSIVMAIYNVENYIREAIDSIINQSFDFNKVQLILIDDGSTDNSKEIALEYQSKYPNNILVLSKSNGGQASSFNHLLDNVGNDFDGGNLDYIKGEYVNFTDSDDILSENTLESVYEFFNEEEDIDLISIPVVFFERKEGNHPLNYKFKEENYVVDLKTNPLIQLSIASSFIKKEAIGNLRFDERLINGYDGLVVNKILLNKMKYGCIGLNKNAVYYYRQRLVQNSIIDTSKK